MVLRVILYVAISLFSVVAVQDETLDPGVGVVGGRTSAQSEQPFDAGMEAPVVDSKLSSQTEGGISGKEELQLNYTANVLEAADIGESRDIDSATTVDVALDLLLLLLNKSAPEVSSPVLERLTAHLQLIQSGMGDNLDAVSSVSTGVEQLSRIVNSSQDSLESLLEGQALDVQRMLRGLNAILSDVRDNQDRNNNMFMDWQNNVQNNLDELQGKVRDLTVFMAEDATELKSHIQMVQEAQQELQSQVTVLEFLQQQLLPGQENLRDQVTALAAHFSGRSTACPPSWSRHNDNCYIIPPEKATWYQAHRACALISGSARLASVHVSNNNFITSLVAESGRTGKLWIGLSRLPSPPHWGWSDGSVLDVTGWGPGEPNNNGGQENCAEMVIGSRKWNDRLCNNEEFFICQLNIGSQA